MTYNRGNASAQVNANRNMDEEARRRAAEEAARKAEEERKRKEEEAKAKAEQEAAQRAAQEAAEAQNQQDNAPSTQNPGTSVMNFKPTAAQRHEIQTNVGWNRAEKKLVEAAPLDLLPPEMEDQREELEKKNQAGQLGSARLKKYSSGDNQYSVDATQFGNVKELAYFCANLSNDADRVKLYKRYAEKNGLDVEDLYYQAETMLGGRAFNYPQSSRGQMEQIGVYDAAGNTLDLGTATAAQVKQAIRMTPPGDDHNALLKAYRRMFGDWETDDSEFDFLDSADLTESNYDSKVTEYEALFEFTDGQLTEDNYWKYLDAVDKIYRDYDNPRVQKQLLRQLALSYEAHTGKKAVSVDELNALAEKLGYIGTFSGLAEKEKDSVAAEFAEKPEAPRHIPEVEEVTSSAAAAQGGGGASGGGYSGGRSASGYAAMAQAPAKNTAEEAAAQTAAVSLAAENSIEPQGPVYRSQEAARETTPEGTMQQYGSSMGFNRQMTDEEALALYKRGVKLDKRNYEQIRWMVEDDDIRALTGNMSMYANMGKTETGGRNVVEKATKYGNRLGTASMVLGSGSLPEDVENEAALTLGNVIYQVKELVSDPRNGISVPKGQNMYDYVLSLPQYAHLAAQVDTVTGAQADVHAAYAQQAQLEKEAQDKHIEDVKAKMLRGEGTPEMAQELAQAYGTEYVDLWDDELYAVYRTQMGERQRFFSDNGTFWQGESAAAQEGNRLRSAGRGYSEFKSNLKYETENLLEDFGAAAKQMGMTLEEYLGAAGIDSLDQVVNIAYNGMLSRGNAYAADADAQAAAGTMISTEKGAWDAAGMGVQHGAESYVADMSQTLYMAVDAADYQLAVIDLENEYIEKYGVEMAAPMYRADLMAYIESGAMSEESAADLADHMRRARSIFDVGYELDPGFIEGLMRDTYEGFQKDVEVLEAEAAKLPSSLRTTFNAFSGAAYSLAGMGTATLAGGLTGSAAVGSALSWGTAEYSSAYDANRAKGMSPGMAGFAALGNAAIATTVNMGGTGTDMDIWWKGGAYQDFAKAMRGKKGLSLMKGIAEATGKYAVKRGAEEAIEEGQEYALGALYDLTDNVMQLVDNGKPVTPSAILKSVGDSLRETDYDAMGKELLQNMGMGFVMGGIFSLGGSAKTAIGVKKGLNMQSRYASIDLATQMAEGNVPFTEENIGKVYAAVQKDLLDARFRKYIDSNSTAALEQKSMLAAGMMGVAETERKSAVDEAQRAQEYSAKAEAAREASKTASGRWWELRDRLASGDLSVEVELESARMQWQKAETALQEAENAAGKCMEKARTAMKSWLQQCRGQSANIKSWMIQEQADQIASLRQSAAEALARRYEEVEAREPVAGPRREQTENAVFGPDVYGRTEADMETEEDVPSVETMTDDELDAELSGLTAQIGDAEKRIADVTAQNAELGLDGETVQAMVDQELTPLLQRRDSIIARETNRFNDLFDRMQQAIEMDNEEAADQLQMEYDSVMERLGKMGVDTESLVMAQYGVTPEAAAEGEAAAQAEAENTEQERLTESLSRRMEHTAMEIERIQPARKYFMDTPLYVNASQKAEILSSEGLKSLSNVNRKYNMKLTDKEAAGAMPLDGHVLSDIAAESAGVVDESANPVEEMLRIMQAGKKLAEDQKTEKNEARELSKKKKAADKKRRESVDKLTGAESKPERQAKKINDVVANQDSTVEDIDRTIDQIEGVSMSMNDGGTNTEGQTETEGKSAFEPTFKDPETQKLARDLYKNWGIRLRLADLDARDEGFYDRESNSIVLNRKLTPGAKQRTVVVHELIHFCEGEAWYKQFKADILGGAYESEQEIEENRERLRDMGYAEDQLDSELVARAAKPLFEGDEVLVDMLLSKGKVSTVKRAYAAITQFMKRAEARKSGNLKRYDMLANARNTLAEGLKSAKAKNGKGTSHMYVGQSADGKGIYESNFPAGTPKDVKRNRLIHLWQNVWSKKPIELNIKEADGTTRPIVANFDPSYDPANVIQTDLGKVMTSQNGSSGDRTVTLNLADDLYDLARTSEYLVSEEERGKNKSTHKDVKLWHYFFNDIIYRGDNGEIPYTVWIDVKEKDDGSGYVYQLYARKTKKDASATASNAYQNPTAGISQPSGQVGTVPLSGLGANAAKTSISDTSLTQGTTDVNSQSMQNGEQHSYGDTALSQFGNKTAQEIDWINQKVKDNLKGTTHEVYSDRAAIQNSLAKIEEMGGVQNAFDDLMNRPADRWNADDQVMAQVLMAKAEYDGDVTTEAVIAMLTNEARSKAGLALQKTKALVNLTSQKAIELVTKISSDFNEKHGGTSQYAPVGDGRPLEKTGMGGDADKIIDRAAKVSRAVAEARNVDDIVEYDNRWHVPLTGAKRYLIDHYKLNNVDLPGINYSRATKKQRQLCAILATDTDVVYDVDMEGNRTGLLGLIQQLEAIEANKAVMTIADLTYIANQSAEMKALSNGAEDPYLDTDGAKHALARMYDAINNTVPVTFGQKAGALAYMNMLSASTTGTKNVLGNIVMGPQETISEAFATLVDKAVGLKTGNRTTTVSTAGEVAEGLRDGLIEVARTVADTYVYQADTAHSRKYDTAGDAPRVFQNKAMEGKRQMVDFIMQLGDRPFFRAEYTRQMAQIKRLAADGKMKKKEVATLSDGRKVTTYTDMPEADMRKEAAQRALERVFQEENEIVNWVNSAPQKIRPFLQAIVPFVKTPMNIAKRMLDYSPVGLGITLAKNGVWDATRGGGFDQRKFVMGVGRGLTGTGMILAGALLTNLGILDVEDGYGEEEDNKLYGAGSANYDPYGAYLNINGNKVSLDWLGAAGTWLTIGAAASKEVDADANMADLMWKATMVSGPEMLNLLFDNTMLSSLSNLLDAEDGEELGENIVSTVGGAMLQQYFSPGDIRQLAKFTDEYERDYRHDNPVIQALNKNVIRYWPFLRQTLPIKYDMTGDPVRQASKYGWGKADENVLLNFLNYYVSPTNIQADKGDKALNELLDLAYRRGETTCIPGSFVATSGKITIPKTMAKYTSLDTDNGENNLILTAEEQRKYNQMYADLCFNGTRRGVRYGKVRGGSYSSIDGIRELINSRAWERMSDEEREKKIKEQMDAAKEIVRAQIVIDRGY